MTGLIELYPGAIHLPGFLSLEEQVALVARCREIGARPAGFYRPRVRGGGQMHVDMCCLGRHWNATTYRYKSARSDFDGLDVQPLPDDLKAFAARAARAAGMAIDADICLVNHYGPGDAMGLHQDKDERPRFRPSGRRPLSTVGR